MQSNFREPKSVPKTRTRTHIFPGVWTIFVGSVVLFIGSVFVTTWTSTGPTFFSVEGSSSKLGENWLPLNH